GEPPAPLASVTAPGTVPDPPMTPVAFTWTAPVPVPVPLNRTVPPSMRNVEPAPKVVGPVTITLPAPALMAVTAAAGVVIPPPRVNVWLVPTVRVLFEVPAKVSRPAELAVADGWLFRVSDAPAPPLPVRVMDP